MTQDCRALTPKRQQSSVLRWRDKLSHQVFEPSCYPLFDIRVTQCAAGVLLHLSLDALMFDGMSMQRLMRTWFELYEMPEKALAPLSITFRDYQQTLTQIYHSHFYEADKAYWLSRIKDLPFGPELPVNTAVLSKPARFKRITQTIDKRPWDAFKAKAQQEKVSLTVR